MENQQMKIILFSEDQKRVRFLEQFFRQQNEIPCSIDHCSLNIPTDEILLRYNPHVVLADFTCLDPSGKETLVKKLERIAETVPLVGLFSEDQTEEALRYVKRGVRDYLTLPLKDHEILKVLRRFHRNGRGTPTLRKTGRVYTFFSLKGGVGNTFVAVNTAISLARLVKKRVLLWDMAFQAGDVPFFLNYEPNYTLADIVDNVDQIDEAYLQGVLSPHQSGVSILAAPTKIEDLERLSSDVVEKILNLFMSHFDHIVIDGGYRLTDPLISLIDASQYLFLTSTLEILSLRSASRCLELFERLNYGRDKIKIIINRYSAKHEAVTAKKAEEILKYEMAHFIHNDYAVASKSVGLGQAVVDAAKGSGLDKQFKALARKIECYFDRRSKSEEFRNPISRVIQKVMHHDAG